MIPPPGVVREIKVVYTYVIERLITAFGIFTILYLLLLLLISGSRKKTNTEKSSRDVREKGRTYCNLVNGVRALVQIYVLYSDRVRSFNR